MLNKESYQRFISGTSGRFKWYRLLRGILTAMENDRRERDSVNRYLCLMMTAESNISGRNITLSSNICNVWKVRDVSSESGETITSRDNLPQAGYSLWSRAIADLWAACHRLVSAYCITCSRAGHPFARNALIFTSDETLGINELDYLELKKIPFLKVANCIARFLI